jgi:protease IV
MAAVILLVGVMAAFRLLFFDHRKGTGLAMTGDKAGVVWIDGDITNSYDIVEWIRELRDDDSVKGVLLRVNSGGGGVAPSREIYSAVSKLQAVKPVIAYFETMAASGAYYCSSPADAIMANPSSITGSIGVLMQLQNWQGLMDKLGISDRTLTSGPYKDAGSSTKPLTPAQREYLQGIVNDLYEQFVTDVATAREMDPEKVRALADGKAMTGARALEAGLVDYLGDDEDAMDMLFEQAKLPDDATVVEGPEVKTSWLDDLLSNIHITVSGAPFTGPALR